MKVVAEVVFDAFIFVCALIIGSVGFGGKVKACAAPQITQQAAAKAPTPRP